MAQWWIHPGDGQVTIDDASIAGLDTSPIPSNVFLLFWHGDYGEIMRKQDATMPVREKFIDPSPYIQIFDRFLLAGENQTPPLTLAQAKRIKQMLLESLFNLKRQLPYGGTNASDTFQVAAIGSLTTDALVAAINAAIDALNANLQSYIRFYVNLDMADIGAGEYLTAINTALDSIKLNTIPTDPPTYTLTHDPMPAQSLYGVQIPANGQYMPRISLDANPAAQSVKGISDRTYALSNVWSVKWSGIEVCTTIAQVAAYDILSGW